MFNIFCSDYFCQDLPKAQEIASEDKFSIVRIADKETKKQRNKETQEVLLKNLEKN